VKWLAIDWKTGVPFQARPRCSDCIWGPSVSSGKCGRSVKLSLAFSAEIKNTRSFACTCRVRHNCVVLRHRGSFTFTFISVSGNERHVIGRTEGMRQLEWLGRRWEDNIRMDLREIGFIWLRIGTSEHSNEPSSSIKGDYCCYRTAQQMFTVCLLCC
jgi:hypothetical protein